MPLVLLAPKGSTFHSLCYITQGTEGLGVGVSYFAGLNWVYKTEAPCVSVGECLWYPRVGMMQGVLTP